MGESKRRTSDPAWIGNFNWTPDWGFRSNEADWLFGVSHRTPVQPWIAALFIADTGARYVISPCGTSANL